MNLKELTLSVCTLAKEAGAFIRAEALIFDQSRVEYKGLNDMVSYVDKNAESIIVKGLAELLPEAGFITEEKLINKQADVYTWIVDPLDGTTNFIHGIPTYSVSIALQRGDDLILGVVYEINRDECFYAWENGGAFLNGNNISVTRHNELSPCLLATGFPYYDFELLEKYLQVFRTLSTVCHGLRRIGSAAVDLAYVACGRFDGYFEYNLNAYDIAAGMVLVREAGGVATGFNGEDHNFVSREILAGNAAVHEKMRAIIQPVFYPI